jgi:hypothetical protein
MRLFEITKPTFALVLAVVLAGCALDLEPEPDPEVASTEQAIFKCGNYYTYWFDWQCDYRWGWKKVLVGSQYVSCMAIYPVEGRTSTQCEEQTAPTPCSNPCRLWNPNCIPPTCDGASPTCTPPSTPCGIFAPMPKPPIVTR